MLTIPPVPYDLCIHIPISHGLGGLFLDCENRWIVCSSNVATGPPVVGVVVQEVPGWRGTQGQRAPPGVSHTGDTPITSPRRAPGLQVLPVLVLELPPEVPLPVPLRLVLAALAECLPVANLEVRTVCVLTGVCIELKMKVIRRFLGSHRITIVSSSSVDWSQQSSPPW